MGKMEKAGEGSLGPKFFGFYSDMIFRQINKNGGVN
jgi:hypothetical protein